MSIEIKEKPDEISFSKVHELLWAANESNRKEGIHLSTAKLSGDELKQRIGENGKCYVALCDNELVGTISFRLRSVNTWYYSGQLLEYMMLAVLPQYRGQHISAKLFNIVFDYALENNYPAVMLMVATKNTHAIAIYKKLGFKIVDFKVYKDLDHDNFIMIKWMKDCPYSESRRIIMYGLRKYYRLLKKYWS